VREESELFVDAVEDPDAPLSQPLQDPEVNARHDVDEDAAILNDDDSQDEMSFRDDPLIFNKSHLSQVMSLFYLRRMKIETDFGKVIGKTDLVLHELVSRGTASYDAGRKYDLEVLTQKIALSDGMQHTGVLGGLVELEGVSAGLLYR
jgi:hypothetical protein